MSRSIPILIALLGSTLLATTVLAATQTDCLQHNRFQSWRAIDENTLVFTDKMMKPYMVKIESRCLGVTRADAHLIFETWEDMSCLDRSTLMYVIAPGLPRRRCMISSVHAGASLT